MFIIFSLTYTKMQIYPIVPKTPTLGTDSYPLNPGAFICKNNP